MAATFKNAADVLREAIKDPKNRDKLAAAKKHPKLKKLMSGVTQNDMVTLNSVAKGAGIVKCTDE
jgi:hypothetical protein